MRRGNFVIHRHFINEFVIGGLVRRKNNFFTTYNQINFLFHLIRSLVYLFRQSARCDAPHTQNINPDIQQQGQQYPPQYYL
ncbi:Uncharacterised protein [Enterobacter hormaechei]|nr:Uncharacterised protein [Enterobacter hormaechei]